MGNLIGSWGVFACLAGTAVSAHGSVDLILSGDESVVDQPVVGDGAVLESDGVRYPVGGVSFAYGVEHDDLPGLESLLDLKVQLGVASDGYVKMREGGDGVEVRVGDLGKNGVGAIYGSGLSVVISAVRDEMESRFGLIGHLVTPSPEEIRFQSEGQEDLRGGGDDGLTVLIWPATVGELRTVARGARIAEAEREEGEFEGNVDHPLHERIRRRIDLSMGDVLTKDAVDREVYQINRHPGRRADVSISQSGEPGAVVLDYLITEPKQWTAYAQASNTGTKSTSEWRERFGFVHRQLTGQDDIFKFDYITADFEDSHAILSSYEFDLGDDVRGKIHGRWNRYTASDVGLGFERFEGEGYEFGAGG